jgi:hypothetical protein
MSFGTGEEANSPPATAAAAATASNWSNYREIVSYVQQSWSLLATDHQLKVYKDSVQ